MNTAAKGQRIEARCSDQLKADGFEVIKAIRIKYHDIDLFGLFDIVGHHPETGKLVFVQVKSNRCDGETRDKVRGFKLPPGCEKWIWIWKDQKGWIKEFYS